MGKARNMAMLSVDTAGAIATTNLTNAPNPIVAGTVAYVGMNSVPTGWLRCNGAAVSRTVYSALFEAIGTTYGTGDGSTTFNLPDLRGEFIRGFDDGRGVDSGRSMGSSQASQMQSHSHGLMGASGTGTTRGLREGTSRNVQGGDGTTSRGYQSTAPTGGEALIQATGGTTNGSETRPRSLAMLAVIKF